MAGKSLDVDGGGSDDDVQIRPLGEELTQIAEDEVDVQAAFVGLVDDDRVIAAEPAITLEFVQQDAVGHQPDHRAGAHPVVEPHRESDQVAHRGPHLGGDAFGDGAGGEPSGLRVADQAAVAAACLDTQLRKLCALARPGLTGHDDNLVRPYGFDQLVPAAR